MPEQPQFVPAMAEIAREAGALLMGYFHRRVKVEYKGDVDLVTEADRASEALITKRIRERWPGHNIMGEEGTRSEQGSEYRWYVDPLDGTTNFAHGYPVFCVSLGLEHKDERVAAVIFDPTRDEMFTAEKGGGAFLNGQPIHVSTVGNLAECLVATGFPSHKRHKNPNIFFYHQITLKTHGVRRAGSAALDLCDVACGRFDGFWEFNLNPWDTAAGVLIVQEAGGRVTRFDGQPFRIDSRETLASNGHVHEALLQEFQAIFRGEGLEELPSVAEYVRARK
ncbi:MAG TPA: inositol monophosphatase family protein [Terriglobales bacterium]